MRPTWPRSPQLEDEESLPAPTISVRGTVPQRARESLSQVLADAAAIAPREVTGIRASLTRHADPAARPAVEARATIMLSGRDVHAHAVGGTEREAIHALETRLQRILDDIRGREVTARR